MLQTKKFFSLLLLLLYYLCLVVARARVVSHSQNALQFSNLNFNSINEHVVTFVVARRASIWILRLNYKILLCTRWRVILFRKIARVDAEIYVKGVHFSFFVSSVTFVRVLFFRSFSRQIILCVCVWFNDNDFAMLDWCSWIRARAKFTGLLCVISLQKIQSVCVYQIYRTISCEN